MEWHKVTQSLISCTVLLCPVDVPVCYFSCTFGKSRAVHDKERKCIYCLEVVSFYHSPLWVYQGCKIRDQSHLLCCLLLRTWEVSVFYHSPPMSILCQAKATIIWLRLSFSIVWVEQNPNYLHTACEERNHIH